MNLKEIERIVCQVLDTRQWVIPYYEKVSAYYGINIEFFLVGKQKDPSIKYGYEDHHGHFYDRIDTFKALVSMVKKDKCDHFLIMEDDVTFTNDANDILSELHWPDKYHNINFGQQLLGIIYDSNTIKEIGELHLSNFSEDFLRRYEDYFNRIYRNQGWFLDIGRQYDDIILQKQPHLFRCLRTWGFAGTVLHNSAFDAIINAPYDSTCDSAIYRSFRDTESPIGNYSYSVFPQIMLDRLLPELQNNKDHIRLPFLWAQENDRILNLGEKFKGI